MVATALPRYMAIAMGDGGLDMRLIYREHAGAVARLLARLLRHPSDTEDALAETFSRAISARSTCKEPQRPLPWLYGIAVNVARETRRKRRPKWWAPWHEQAEPLSPPTPYGERAAVNALYGVLDSMSEERRELLVLRLLMGLDLVDVATARGFSLATCKRHLVAAETQFRHLVAANPELVAWHQSAYGRLPFATENDS